MRKVFIVALAAIAGLATLVGVLSAARSRHILAASRILPSAYSSSADNRQQDTASDDPGTPSVIQIASNPMPMPPFLVNDLNGEPISTAALRGKVVILNFWATWCPPCREELPEMIALAARYKDRLQIIGVSMDDEPANEVQQFARKMGVSYPVVMGSDAISREYGGIPVLPTSFVISPDGRIVQKHAGLYPIGVYDSEVRYLLGMPVSAKVETFEDTGQIFLKNAINATELPGVDFKGLTPSQKRLALKRMNSEQCTCGCGMTIAQCRINDPDCEISPSLAKKIIQEIRAGGAGPSPPAALAR